MLTSTGKKDIRDLTICILERSGGDSLVYKKAETANQGNTWLAVFLYNQQTEFLR
jgi:hypothetical protein